MSEDILHETSSPVVGAVNGRLKARFRARSYTVVFTPTQTIFARFTTALLKQEIADERSAAKEHGAGWMGRWKAQMGAAATFVDRYKSMSVEEILAEHQKNHAIDNQSVQSVHLSNPVTTYDDDSFDVKNPLLTIETPGKTYKLRLDDAMDHVQVRDLLRQVYGPKLQ